MHSCRGLNFSLSSVSQIIVLWGKRGQAYNMYFCDAAIYHFWFSWIIMYWKTVLWIVILKLIIIIKDCASAVPGGPCCLTFVPDLWLENVRLFIEIISWVHWISLVQSTGLPSIISLDYKNVKLSQLVYNISIPYRYSCQVSLFSQNDFGLSLHVVLSFSIIFWRILRTSFLNILIFFL